MNEAHSFKVVEGIAPAAIKDNADYSDTEIDTLGFDYAVIIFHVGATDIAMATLAIQESDTSGSGHANITGLVWGTSNNIAGSTSALPSATDDNTFQIAQIDLRKRKRYLQIDATAGDGTNGSFLSAVCLLFRAKQRPATATEFGADEVLRV